MPPSPSYRHTAFNENRITSIYCMLAFGVHHTQTTHTHIAMSVWVAAGMCTVCCWCQNILCSSTMRAKKEKSPHTFWAFLSLSLSSQWIMYTLHTLYIRCSVLSVVVVRATAAAYDGRKEACSSIVCALRSKSRFAQNDCYAHVLNLSVCIIFSDGMLAGIGCAGSLLCVLVWGIC